MMKRIHVAVGVVLNSKRELLIAKRPEAAHQGGLWEFPGGKVEKDEDVFTALVREFQEEVGITILTAEPLMIIEHNYTDKTVLLDIWQCKTFNGIASGLEGQEIKWIALNEVHHFSFPEANQKIIERLQKEN